MNKTLYLRKSLVEKDSYFFSDKGGDNEYSEVVKEVEGELRCYEIAVTYDGKFYKQELNKNNTPEEIKEAYGESTLYAVYKVVGEEEEVVYSLE